MWRWKTRSKDVFQLQDRTKQSVIEAPWGISNKFQEVRRYIHTNPCPDYIFLLPFILIKNMSFKSFGQLYMVQGDVLRKDWTKEDQQWWIRVWWNHVHGSCRIKFPSTRNHGFKVSKDVWYGTGDVQYYNSNLDLPFCFSIFELFSRILTLHEI